jgi:hypothetical protein
MPEWLEQFLGDVTLLQALAWVAIAAALIAAVVKLWPVLRKAIKLTDSLADLPDFMEQTKTQLAEIHHEVHYNNGSSVKDAQRRTEAAVARVEEGVAGLHQKFEEHLVDAAERDRRIREIEDTQPHPRSGVPQPRRKK